jgi:hypothetical protein
VGECVKQVGKLNLFQSKKKGLSFYIENLSPLHQKLLRITNDAARLKQILFNKLIGQRFEIYKQKSHKNCLGKS